jgi:hypothetical protein
MDSVICHDTPCVRNGEKVWPACRSTHTPLIVAESGRGFLIPLPPFVSFHCSQVVSYLVLVKIVGGLQVLKHVL